MHRPRSIPTTVPLPPELRARVERVREAMRRDNPDASLNDALRRCVRLGVDVAESDQRPPPVAA